MVTRRYTFRHLGPHADPWREKEKEMADSDVQWRFTFFLDPILSGRGIMTVSWSGPGLVRLAPGLMRLSPGLVRRMLVTRQAVIRFILEWFVKTDPDDHGQLIDPWYDFKRASARVHDGLDFLPVARVNTQRKEDEHGDDDEDDLICAVWQGGGRCTHKESVFAELEPVSVS